MQYSFGSGNLFGRSTASNTPTPVRFGGLQGVNIDMSFTTKELYGQNQFPIDISRAAGKISIKANFAQLNAQALNDLFFGETAAMSANPTEGVTAEAATVSSNTVTVSHNSTFLQDYGVVNATTGAILARVASAPAGTGNYSCNESTGVYTFNTAMNNTAVNISYTYTDTGNGNMFTITNKVMGTQPNFVMLFSEVHNGKRVTLKLNSCISSQLTFNTKLEDYTIPDFSAMAFADASGNIGTLSFDE